MPISTRRNKSVTQTLPKCPTGIVGLDEITGGGLPRGRPTLICGGAGCGKSLMSLEFLIRGVTEFDEPGVLMSFEEPTRDIVQNVTSLGFDLDELINKKKLFIDHVHVDRNEIEETGEYDLEAIFIRLNYAIDTTKAKRVVLDTIETLFSGLSNDGVLRSELRRLFHWLKEKGVTAVITGEQGDSSLTRQGLEEYVSDCVIFLDHRIIEQISTRRLRVVKYRGSTHGTNEYPFLIDAEGITVLPVTSLGLNHQVSNERVPSGVAELDEMLGGKGYYRGSSVLVSGTAGAGKSSLSAHFVNAACRRGERCLYFAFEESPDQIIRNMRSIGIDLAPWVKNGRLIFHSARPTVSGLEMHLATIYKSIRDFKPDAVVIDPISNLVNIGKLAEVNAMLLRVIDLLKSRNITAFFTSLTTGGEDPEGTELGMSSLMDTWLLLRDIELNGERNRGLYVLKSRGMAHSNQIREFLLTDNGIKLIDVYLGSGGLMTGSSRVAQEAKEQAEQMTRKKEVERTRVELQRKREAMEAQIRATRAAFEADEAQLLRTIEEDRIRELTSEADRDHLAASRRANVRRTPVNANGKKAAKLK